jgi:2-phosphoglycerate kinase
MDNNINYKTSQTYKLFELINDTKDIIAPVIIGEYNYDTLISKEHEINDKYKSTYMTLTNKDENGKWERFILKIRDYGYTTKTITYLYEISKYFEIHDFSLSKISEKYIMDITLKLNEKIFSKSEETTLYMFAISQLFFQLLITTLIRKKIYIK